MSLLVLALCLVIPVFVYAGEWKFQFYAGSAHSFQSSLEIEQGTSKLRLDAKYETRPFEDSPYYAYRVGRWSGGAAWEVELVHHKLYLRNNPPEIRHFEVTHGYNLLLFNRAWAWRSLILRAGAGPVITHAESEIREEFLNAGYQFTGPALQGSIEKRFILGRRFFLAAEAKLTAARTVVDVAGGRAHVPNVALHGLFGVGISL